MTGKKWLSLRNSAIRINRVEKTRPDSEWHIIGWPKLDLDDEKIKDFIIAASKDKISARGHFSKVSISKHPDYRPEFYKSDVFENILQDKAVDIEIQDSYLQGFGSEVRYSKIDPEVWQPNSILWERNQLIEWRYESFLERSKKLRAQPRDRNIRWILPELHMYMEVEIEEGSLNRWLDEPISASCDTPADDDANAVILIKGNKGRTRDKRQWEQIIRLSNSVITTGKEFRNQAHLFEWICEEMDKENEENDNRDTKVDNNGEKQRYSRLTPSSIIKGLKKNHPGIWNKLRQHY